MQHSQQRTPAATTPLHHVAISSTRCSADEPGELVRMYQTGHLAALSDMPVSTSVMRRPASPSMEGRRVIVEFRAATPAEVRSIDTTASEIILPAHLLMSRAEWRKANSALPAHHPGPHIQSNRPPGSLIWGQLASRSGSMMVGGRDSVGMPAVPMPSSNGDIVFVSTVPAQGAGTSSSERRLPTMSVEHVIVELDECQPIIAADGAITCGTSICAGCLTVLTRNSWYTSIACVCE